MFERQFEQDGDDFIYRKYGTGTAYRVTVAEREEFVADFRRSMRLATFCMVALVLLGVGIAAAMDVGKNSAIFFAFGIAGCLPLWLVIRRLYAKPKERLQHRRRSAPAMTDTERRRHGLGQISYLQLILAPLAGLLAVSYLSKAIDIESQWGRTVWLIPIALSVLAIVQAWRKFRLSQEG